MTSSVFDSEKLLFTPATPKNDAIPLIFAFPNEYTVGITSLGYQVVWATLAMRDDLQVSRLFTDIQEQLPRHPEILGFSMSWELDYVNIFNLLESLNIPLRASNRTENHPLVFGGGPVLTANPEPFADFFDVVLLGDGEILLSSFIDAYQEVRNATRKVKLNRLAQVPGIYIPSLYDVEYASDDGEIKSIHPLDSHIPAVIQKQTYRGNTLSASTIVTEKAAWENIFMVEVVRSCPEMCRFCLASYLTLPFRTASLEKSLIPAIEQGLKVTNRLGLLGASVTQHPEFSELLDYISQPKYDDVRLSVASVRTNTVTEKLAATLAKRDTRSLTIAVESGSENLRQIINKKLDNEEIIQAAVNAKAGGLSSLKLYGMVGIPGEESEDLDATVAMMKAVKKAAFGLRVTLGCSTFVPKSHTPFQWFGVNKQSEKRLQFLQKQLKPQGIDFRPESYNWSIIQTLLSRGDRRLSHLLELTRGFGDSLGSYKRAFKELKGKIPDLDFYVYSHWSTEKILPWNHLQGPLQQSTLIKHLHEATSHFRSASPVK
ncbi:radical SAM protein [Sphaerospermopsis kisseleviana CS-549]|uniref:Radical SAM protein n=1 Tax=Sphaerospermopsis kisseleviana CS-549 TaxID=3021783 RepID=A0ABT4ZU63_9CYAN|nr:radical SAM protein [Sphaerospermopsis kisseleviana]MDB9442283.1 radical SAM protein [Sphaerospermopsis kisseleviana CS-549]BAZ80090.1 radical SAM domain-containing protein [Sphaerospermopsis kisseleviana NIES-73]